MLDIDSDFWSHRRVFLTGHTGFKGAWTHFWLRQMGAQVFGYALAPETEPSLHTLLQIDDHYIADIRDQEQMSKALRVAEPDIVIHMAAQALVRRSFDDPVGTFASNVIGVVGLLNAVRTVPSIRGVVIVASDKCYENHEWAWPYRETDAMGGYDPYSASKGTAELAVSSMRRSFFQPHRPDGHPARIASVRCGNVIGGGDWSADRLVPDIIRAWETGTVEVRNPHAIRPWQHVLEAIAAYLGLAQRLYEADETAAAAFNIGPDETDVRSVGALVDAMCSRVDGITRKSPETTDYRHEANSLRLDCALAKSVLGWQPRWGFDEAVANTVDWYQSHRKGGDPAGITASQIAAFEAVSPYRKKT